MSTSAGRQRSIISAAGLSFDESAPPVQNSNLLNKAASQSVSLYQRCSALRARLMQIRGFPHYFSLASASNGESTDPVAQLWDLFSLGISLCFIFDQLPPDFKKIDNSAFDQAKYDANPKKAKQHAIAMFAIQMHTDKVMQNIPGCERFTVTDLWDRKSTDGLVKVVETVTAIVNYLPSDAFETTSPSYDADNPAFAAPASAQDAERNNGVREIVESERKYVEDLETMQKYATALAQGNLIDQDTIHLLFPNLNKLLNFQRTFLIRLESTAELAWQNQQWGQHFLQSEEEFSVYEPYCANYTNAFELMLANEQNLVPLNYLINCKTELPAFLIKPIQRVCKYPLLLDRLIKASSAETYQHYDELKLGSDAAKRITDKINEAQRRAENQQTVKALRTRVDDWKGHHIENFGDLLLTGVFVVTKSDIDREYHMFLFEKIILCCKEEIPPENNNRRSKSNSILSRQSTRASASRPPSSFGGVQPAKNATRLILKGRIFLGNVTRAVPVPPRNSTASAGSASQQFPLAVWWRGDNDLESFTLRCPREDQMRQWEAQINRLIEESAQRRKDERSGTQSSQQQFSNNTQQFPNSTNPRQPAPYSAFRPGSNYVSNSNYVGGGIAESVYDRGNGRAESVYDRNRADSVYDRNRADGVYDPAGGPQGYPAHDGFEPDEEDFEDYPPSAGASGAAYPNSQPSPAAYPQTGAGYSQTSLGMRRVEVQSMPPERDAVPGYDAPRAQTEDMNGSVMAQWRNNNLMPPPRNPDPAARTRMPRVDSNASLSSSGYASETSGGGSISAGRRSRPPLRSQISATRVGAAYDGMPPPGGPKMTRARSISQPRAYVPKTVAPPMPALGQQWDARGSFSSQSTDNSSDSYSRPVTPFDSAGGYPPVKLKVYFAEDIFVLQVHRTTEFDELVETIERKVKLCGPRENNVPLRFKYRDEDGDMVSMTSTEDVQMAFDQYRPGGQVALYVT
ncbi:hypothetical protein C8R44DRAFT_854734 [Mycena epipterygia]|nr:hypothetical protein C8R44DRAFT_854734 [Mycena epipterygia]